MHGKLRDRWVALEDEEKRVWRRWASWDKRRHERDFVIYRAAKNSDSRKKTEETVDTEELPPENGDKDAEIELPKKRKSNIDVASSEDPFGHIPKKKSRSR